MEDYIVKNRRFALIAFLALSLGIMGTSALAAEKKTARKSSEAQQPASQKESTKSSAVQPASTGGPVDLNTSTKEQLMTIPGITADYANKIIEGRPYREKITLRRQNILPADLFYDVMDKITVDQKKLDKLLKGKEKGQTKKKK